MRRVGEGGRLDGRAREARQSMTGIFDAVPAGADVPVEARTFMP